MYKCTAGKDTIGYGTNISDGIDTDEAEAMLLIRVLRDERRLIDVLGPVHPKAMAVCLNMMYQLGEAGFMQFRTTIRLLRLELYSQAADALLDSKFARQTPNRARRHADVLRSINGKPA